MDALVQRVAETRRPLLVDIANVNRAQLRRLAPHARHMVFVSTHKTFNYMVHTERRWPRALAGARWLVLRVPGTDGRMTRFDGHAFAKTATRSPVQWHRHGHHHCSVRQRGRAESPRAHYYCELDDLVLAKSSLDLGVDVFTNDLGLRRAIVTQRVGVTSDMARLLGATRTTLLAFDGDAWACVPRRPAPLSNHPPART